MDETTSYNLAINELKRQKLALDKEVADLIYKRDTVYNEIADQRNWKGIVQKEKKDIEEKKYSIMEQLEIISKTLTKSRQDFVNSTEKEKNYLIWLERSIEEKKELESKFLIKEFELKNIENKIKDKNSELISLNIELSKVSEYINSQLKDIEEDKLKLNKRLNIVEEKEEYLHTKQMNLEKKEKELEIKEKRLNKLSEDLKEKI